MERRRKMGFTIDKVVTLFNKRFPENVTAIQFQAAQETRFLEEQDIASIANRYAGRQIAFVIAFKRDHRNAEAQEIVFAKPSKEEPPIQSEFQIIPGE